MVLDLEIQATQKPGSGPAVAEEIGEYLAIDVAPRLRPEGLPA